jgi:drug/metabolite transporter (DMT)-like permease
MTEQPRPLGGHKAAGHGGHSWMMIACCIPMIVIAIALVATGVASPGFLFTAVACTVMMALMMRGMDHGGGAPSDDTDRSTHAGHGR